MGYESDIQAVLGQRHCNGADFWAGPDEKVYVGNPFSTIGSLLILHELGVPAKHETVRGALALVRNSFRPDGKARLGPSTPLYPCYTAEAARTLCRFDMAETEEVGAAVERFLATAEPGGGWRCSFTKFGKGPETQAANPGATLYTLDVLRHYKRFREGHEVSNRAVEFLLAHWRTREPLGPCHWGIGTTFLSVEFPFLRYNLFYYVYVLSHFRIALGDERFAEAFGALEDKLDAEGRMVVERPHRRLGKFVFCRRGAPSQIATERFGEIRSNLG